MTEFFRKLFFGVPTVIVILLPVYVRTETGPIYWTT